MFLGIDIGSSSSKVVILSQDQKILASHVVNLGTGTRGVQQALNQALQKAGIRKEDLLFTVVTGYGRMNYSDADKQITEISCHAKGVQFLENDVRTIIDIGGQDTKVIRLDSDGLIENFVMNDKCAAGTGRFLEVMARVLDCNISALSDLAKNGQNPVPISNMCTVFAESEVISHLSSSAAVEDVAAGAILSIAARVAGMAGRVGIQPSVMMTGGGALNQSLVDALSEKICFQIRVPENPQVIGALGAAVFAYGIYHNGKMKPA
ncbi:MAG: hadI [Evtepia sp.]|jgi:predicted CoA-substrate-specific enzyme activase|nr:hadI [Evtepia sp.]